MIKQSIGDINYFCFGNLQKHLNLRHFISTREGGCSTGKFGTLNLSIKLEPDSTCALENRKRLLQSVGLPIETLTLGSQTHSSNVVTVEKSMAGSGSQSFQSALPDTDALITSSPTNDPSSINACNRTPPFSKSDTGAYVDVLY